MGTFDIPRDVILPVDEIDVRLDPAPHPYEAGRQQAIADNWRREVLANPALFDGQVVLLSELAYRDRRLIGRCHTVGYSTFLHWRRDRVGTVAHAFAHAVLVSSDNALIAIRMAANTANPGRVYFAAGSFEPCDFFDGKVDGHFNMVREVGEETGIDISSVARGERHHAMSVAAGTVIFRTYHLPMTADEAEAAITAFVAAEDRPEIDGPVVIRHAEDFPDGLAPHMPAIIRWHFGGRGGERSTSG